MFKWLRKDPVGKLKNEYTAKLKEACDLQRNGDLHGYSDKTAEAEAILKQVDAIEAERKP